MFGPTFEKLSKKFSQKTQIEQFSNPPLSLKIKSITLPLTILAYISKIDKNLVTKTENVNKNNGISCTIHKNLNRDNFLKNGKSKNLLISYSMLDGLSNDTNHNSLQ